MLIDAHTHVGEKGAYHGRSKDWSFEGAFNGKQLVAILDEHEIDFAVCFGMGRTGPTTGVKLTIDAVQSHPDRLAGFYRADPWNPASVGEFEKAVREYGLKGLKLHPEGEGFQANHPVVFPLMEKAAELGVPCTIHSHQRGSVPTLIGDLAARFPQVTVIMAHMGMHQYNDAIYVAEKEDNIILETSVQPWIHRIARLVVDKIGPERLIYGSDTPLHHPRVELTKIEVADLNDQERELVLGGNINRILKLGL
ncbi:MAG: amidohydrolase family protein [Thermaerobacterales bacterium]